jgi:hypothetical protein
VGGVQLVFEQGDALFDLTDRAQALVCLGSFEAGGFDAQQVGSGRFEALARTRQRVKQVRVVLDVDPDVDARVVGHTLSGTTKLC